MRDVARRLAALEAGLRPVRAAITSEQARPIVIGQAATIAFHLGGWSVGADAYNALAVGIAKAHAHRYAGNFPIHDPWVALNDAHYHALCVCGADFGMLRSFVEQFSAGFERCGVSRLPLANEFADIFDRLPDLDWTKRADGASAEHSPQWTEFCLKIEAATRSPHHLPNNGAGGG